MNASHKSLDKIDQVLIQLRAVGSLMYSASMATPSASWLKPDWGTSGRLIAEKAEEGLEIIEELSHEEEKE